MTISQAVYDAQIALIENLRARIAELERERDELKAALADADEPAVYLDEGLGVFYWPAEYKKLPHRDFVPLYKRAHKMRGDDRVAERSKALDALAEQAQALKMGYE